MADGSGGRAGGEGEQCDEGEEEEEEEEGEEDGEGARGSKGTRQEPAPKKNGDMMRGTWTNRKSATSEVRVYGLGFKV